MKPLTINGLEMKVSKDFYTGLWNIKYADGFIVWAGPFRTKKEAIAKLMDNCDE